MSRELLLNMLMLRSSYLYSYIKFTLRSIMIVFLFYYSRRSSASIDFLSDSEPSDARVYELCCHHSETYFIIPSTVSIFHLPPRTVP